MPVDPSDISIFAQTNFRGMQRKFGIKTDDRRRHMYVVGKTGMGKSTLLENMIIDDIKAGRGVAVVDPHGDLAEKIIKAVPSNRTNDVIYFNPADTQYPIAFNILENVSEDYKHLVAYGLIGVFKKIWADSWGPRLEYILTNTILALLDYPGSTLLGVMRMLVDKAYRKKVVSKIKDPVVKTFWTDEFANYSEKFRNEAIAPIQNKVGQFLASSIIRNIVGQSKSTIEMRDIMDNRKILIMNLAKGRIGEENSALLGAMMITKLQIAAMSRVDIPEGERKDFYLYVDEFQNFATDSFAGILSEARKYRLNLIMAHQYMEQLGDVVKAAVFGNVGTMVVFRVGAADAAELEAEFAPQFTPEDIVNVNKYNFIMRLMIDGIATEPFSAIGLPPVADEDEDGEKIVKVSRERYARPREVVEDRILRWSGVEIKKEKSTEETEVPSMESTSVIETEEEPETANENNEEIASEVQEEPTEEPQESKSEQEMSELEEQLHAPVSLIPGMEPQPSHNVEVEHDPKLAMEELKKAVAEELATEDAEEVADDVSIEVVEFESDPVETPISIETTADDLLAGKPKINFVQSELEEETTEEPEVIPATTEQVTVEFDSVDDEDDMEEVLPVENVAPEPSEVESTSADEPVTNEEGAVSLFDLKQGKVEPVAFRGKKKGLPIKTNLLQKEESEPEERNEKSEIPEQNKGDRKEGGKEKKEEKSKQDEKPMKKQPKEESKPKQEKPDNEKQNDKKQEKQEEGSDTEDKPKKKRKRRRRRRKKKSEGGNKSEEGKQQEEEPKKEKGQPKGGSASSKKKQQPQKSKPKKETKQNTESSKKSDDDSTKVSLDEFF